MTADEWEATYQDSLTYLISKSLDADSRGHFWKRDDIIYPDGYVGADIFAYEGGQYCNGPKCETCGYGFCHHCRERPEGNCPRPLSDEGREAAITLARAKRGGK